MHSFEVNWIFLTCFTSISFLSWIQENARSVSTLESSITIITYLQYRKLFVFLFLSDTALYFCERTCFWILKRSIVTWSPSSGQLEYSLAFFEKQDWLSKFFCRFYKVFFVINRNLTLEIYKRKHLPFNVESERSWKWKLN